LNQHQKMPFYFNKSKFELPKVWHKTQGNSDIPEVKTEVDVDSKRDETQIETVGTDHSQPDESAESSVSGSQNNESVDQLQNGLY